MGKGWNPLFSRSTRARAYNHACAHIQKLDWAFVLFSLLSSPIKFKNTDETEAPLAAIYAWHFEKRRRERERERDREKKRNIVKEDECGVARSRWRKREVRSWGAERRAKGRKREIGAYGTDGGGRAVNEMRLGRRKPSASTAAGLAPPAMRRKTPERACGKHKSQTLVSAIYIGTVKRSTVISLSLYWYHIWRTTNVIKKWEEKN